MHHWEEEEDLEEMKAEEERNLVEFTGHVECFVCLLDIGLPCGCIEVVWDEPV